MRGCHRSCVLEKQYKTDGSCDFCGGYCCRGDGYDNNCAQDIINQVSFPAEKGHYCLDRENGQFAKQGDNWTLPKQESDCLLACQKSEGANFCGGKCNWCGENAFCCGRKSVKENGDCPSGAVLHLHQATQSLQKMCVASSTPITPTITIAPEKGNILLSLNMYRVHRCQE